MGGEGRLYGVVDRAPIHIPGNGVGFGLIAMLAAILAYPDRFYATVAAGPVDPPEL
jgi:hypothetical protein